MELVNHLIREVGLLPVSYTHLDVYKRQEQGGFGMQRLGFGLSFGDGGGFQRERVAILPAGEMCIRDRVELVTVQ